jgi:hypothetical protein
MKRLLSLVAAARRRRRCASAASFPASSCAVARRATTTSSIRQEPTLRRRVSFLKALRQRAPVPAETRLDFHVPCGERVLIQERP